MVQQAGVVLEKGSVPVDGMRTGAGAMGRLALCYIGLTFALTWACWGVAAALIQGAGTSGWAATLAGSFQVAGTLMPLLATYILFPRMRGCGLVPARRAGDGGAGDVRFGFWSFVLGIRPRPAGIVFFALLAVWRWTMFYLGFGFPDTPGLALSHFFTTLPALLLGGGFEEVGWRGCLAPALEGFLGGVLGNVGGRRGRCTPADLALPRVPLPALGAPLVTGVVWACWHIPLFFMPGAYQNGIPFLAFLGVAVALSFSLTALYRTSGSLALCVVSHAWYNAMLVEPFGGSGLAAALFALEALAGAAIIACSVSGRGRRKTPAKR